MPGLPILIFWLNAKGRMPINVNRLDISDRTRSAPWLNAKFFSFRNG